MAQPIGQNFNSFFYQNVRLLIYYKRAIKIPSVCCFGSDLAFLLKRFGFAFPFPLSFYLVYNSIYKMQAPEIIEISDSSS
jgi:hypothetical protein